MPKNTMGNTPERIAAELKRVRQAAGLSQEQMAEQLGIVYAPGGRKVSTGRAAVSAWERGRRAPAAHHLQAYVDLGGDPALLAADLDSRPQAAAPVTPGLEAGTVASDLGQAASAEPAATPATLVWHGRRWRWFVLSPSLVVAALGVAFLAGAFHSSSAGSATTWTETTGTPAHTWANATQLTGAGTPLGPRQSVQVSCRVRGYVVLDGDPWWYRLASAPWNGRYYATSDAFYNDGSTSGPVDTGVVVDEQIPLCS